MHSDADVNRSLSRDPCWTFRSQSSVFCFLESLDFDQQSLHGTIDDDIKTRQYCSPPNVFFFSGSSHFGKNYQRKSFIKYHLHKKSRAYTLYTFRGQILRKWPRAIPPKMSSRFSKVPWTWLFIKMFQIVCNTHSKLASDKTSNATVEIKSSSRPVIPFRISIYFVHLVL